MYLAIPVTWRLQISAHVLPSDDSRTTRKDHEAGPPEQLTTDALSQIDYGNT